MFYNYLIFNMVTLSLRILLKYCVSTVRTASFNGKNCEFPPLKLIASKVKPVFSLGAIVISLSGRKNKEYG